MEISITRGLAELKLLDKRINKEINQGSFVQYHVGKKPVKGFNSNQEFESKAKSDYTSVLDLLKRRNAIKSAIVLSNATTKVRVVGIEMTVAEAIERKTSIELKKQLLNKLIHEFNNVNNTIQVRNDEVQYRLDNLLQTHFGKESKAKSDEIDSITKPFLENNELKIVDPLKISDVIEKLSKEIDEFESEIDFVLSESNTITKIVITD